MKTIKILVPLHTLPNVKSVTTIFFENLLPILRKKINVQMIWLVYTPDKLSNSIHSADKVLDIHDYKNAVEVIQSERPDLVFGSVEPVFIEQAFSIAAKSFGIPVFSWFISNIVPYRKQTHIIKSYLTRFFQSSVPTDTDLKQKQFMRRGRFFVFKYVFLLRTQLALKIDLFRISSVFLSLLKSFFIPSKFIANVKFSNDLHFLDNEILLKSLLEAGFVRSSLMITGNPIYDSTFHRVNKIKNSLEKKEKIRVLLAPSTLYEAGFWTRDQRDTTITKIVTKILEHKNEILLTIKIHPSSSVFSDYEMLINSIDPTIPIYQEGDVRDFLSDSDVEISFSTSTAEVYSLLFRKPIIICDFFNIQSDLFIERGLAARCTNPSLLIDAIHKVVSSNPATEQKRYEFITEFLYKGDGLASERICEGILLLLERNNNKIN